MSQWMVGKYQWIVREESVDNWGGVGSQSTIGEGVSG